MYSSDGVYNCNQKKVKKIGSIVRKITKLNDTQTLPDASKFFLLYLGASFFFFKALVPTWNTLTWISF